MTGNQHRILQQVLELDLAAPLSAAPGLQEQAARPFREGTLPGLEALFDRVAGPGRLLRLERLEVDLGELRGPDWPEQLVERLADRLEEALQEAAARSTPAGATWEPEPSHAAQGSLEQLLFFLVHGRLPWWGARLASGWSEGHDAAFSTAQWQQLGDLLRRDHQALVRLVQVAGDRFLAGMVAALAGLDGTDQVLRLLAPEEDDPRGEAYRSWRRRFWTELLKLALAAPPAPDTSARLMRRLLGGRPAVESGSASPVGLRAIRRPAELPALPPPWQEWLEASLAAFPEARLPAAEQPTGESAHLHGEGRPAPELKATRGRAERPPALDRGSAGRSTGAAPPGTAAPAEAPPAHRTAAGPPTAFRPAENEAVYLPGAGAVILHPFLSELFASRGLLEGPLFRDEAARHHAIHLLGQLTFGVEAPEHDLLLPKLLCGMAWEKLLRPGELDDEDLAACDELLAAVLGHWQVLKSSSADWLREQFFLREGKLDRVDDGWKLSVESRVQDVLLTRLPWGLGTIRLPWLTEILHVSWTA